MTHKALFIVIAMVSIFGCRNKDNTAEVIVRTQIADSLFLSNKMAPPLGRVCNSIAPISIVFNYLCKAI